MMMLSGFQAVRRSSRSARWMLGTWLALTAAASAVDPPAPKPLSPAEERATFRLTDPEAPD